jgi:phosphatidylglycerophosphate synthase
MQQGFTGDRHAPMVSPLARLEQAIIRANVHKIPRWIEGYHLTLMTIAWTIGVLVFGWAAQYNLHWLWASSACIALQWFTDSFDGALGRLRDTGIPKWGYFTDHLLDFFFMWAVFVSYVFLLDPGSWHVHMLFALAFLYTAMMANSFLHFSVTGAFKITYLGTGPTEVRVAFVVLNMIIVFRGPEVLEWVLPYALAAFAGATIVIFYFTQREIWQIDMAAKRARMAAHEKEPPM